MAVLLLIVAAGCLPVKPPPDTLQISTTPDLFPSFNSSITNYVSRCDSSAPVQVAVSAPSDTTVSVDGQPAQTGSFTAEVSRDVGQSFTIVTQTSSDQPSTYYVRCLPADYPTFRGWGSFSARPLRVEDRHAGDPAEGLIRRYDKGWVARGRIKVT